MNGLEAGQVGYTLVRWHPSSGVPKLKTPSFVMFNFLKNKFARTDSADSGSGFDSESCIRCTNDGRFIVMNLDYTGWNMDTGSLGCEKMFVRPPGGHEVFGENELERNILAKFNSIRTSSSEHAIFKHGLENDSTLISFLPGTGETRFRGSEVFEKFLKEKFGVKSKSIDSIKIYSSLGRANKARCVRKLRGKGEDHVIFNLTGETFNYFHYWKKDADVTIDSLMDDWPVGGENLATRVEDALRSLDLGYFDRIRNGLNNGLLILILPEDANDRNLTLGTAERLFQAAPGGAIELSDSRVIRVYRRRGSQR